MKTLKHWISATVLVLTTSSAIEAQVSVDMSKFTCEQLTGGPPQDALETSLWISGFYNGQRNNTMLDLKLVKQNTEAVVTHCLANPKKTVMQAIDTLLATNKK